MNSVNTRYFRAVLAVFLVVGVAGASFYVSNRIAGDKSVSPNSPESNPLALILSEEQYEKIYGEPPRTYTPPKPPVNEKERDPTAAPFRTAAGNVTSTPSRTPTPSKSPTPTVQTGTNFGDKATEQQKASGPSYMSDSSNKCDDGQGFISGTGCSNGKRFVIGGSEKAYQEHLAQATNKVVNTSDTELIALGISSGTVACDETKPDCINKLVEAGTKVLLNESLILGADRERLAKSRTLNQATNDVLQLSDTEFELKYGISDREAVLFMKGMSVQNAQAIVADQLKLEKFTDRSISDSQLAAEVCGADTRCRREFQREDILSGVTSYSEEYKDQVVAGHKAQEKTLANIDKYRDLYISRDSDEVVAREYCTLNTGTRNLNCEKNFVREDLLSYFADPNQLVQEKKDIDFAEYYADTKMSNTTLSRIYCDGKTNEINCLKEFERDQVLSSINSDSIRQTAQTNRIINLNNLIVPVINGQPISSSINNETKNEALKLNQDTAHATWVYIRENSRFGTDPAVLTQMFNEQVKKNPSILLGYIEKYNQNPSLYDREGIFYDYSKEENPLIISEYNQIIKTQPIEGLFEDSKLLSYKLASEEYKQQAREKACEEEKSIQVYCRTVIHGTPGEKASPGFQNALKQIELFMAQGNNGQNYIKEVYDDRTTNLLLSVSYSNLAVVDNTSTNNNQLREEIKNANQYAEGQEFRNSIFRALALENPLATPETVTAVDTKYISNLTPEQKTDIANEYIRRQLVVETYTRGAGVAGALAAATAATLACTAATGGVGAIVAVGCGIAGGAGALIANIAPIWGSSTAEEIEAERQYWVQKTGGNEFAGTLVQSLYSNQGAASDESWWGGRSQSTLDNPFALLESIHNIGITNTSVLSDSQIMSQIAIQPYLLAQGEALQQENANQAAINIPITLLVSGITGGVGSNLATIKPTTLNTVLREGSMFLGGSALNAAQTQLQFNATTGFIDTQSEINLELCIRKNGANACQEEWSIVSAETTEANKQTQIQTALTDAIIQVGQGAASFTGATINQTANIITNIINPPKANTSVTSPSMVLSTLDANNITPELANLLNTPIEITTPPPPKNGLDSKVITAINEIVQSPDFSTSQMVEFLRLNPDLDNTDINFAVTAVNDQTYKNYLNEPNPENFNALVASIKESTDALSGGNGMSPDLYIEALETAHSHSIALNQIAIENLLAPVRNELGVSNNTGLIAKNNSETLQATRIDTKQEALKVFIAEEATKITPSTPNEITSLLQARGHSQEDINYVLSVANKEIVSAGITKIRKFEVDTKDQLTRLEQAYERNGNTTTVGISAYKQREAEIRQDFLNEIAGIIAKETNTNSSSEATANTNPITPPRGLPSNIESIIDQFSGDNTVVSRIDNINNNYRVIYTDRVGDANKNDAILVRYAQEELGIDIKNKSFAQIVEEIRTKTARETSPPLALTNSQRRVLASQYIGEQDSLAARPLSDTEYKQAAAVLQEKYRQLGIAIDSGTGRPEGYSAVRVAFQKLANLFIKPGKPEDTNTTLALQPENTQNNNILKTIKDFFLAPFRSSELDQTGGLRLNLSGKKIDPLNTNTQALFGGLIHITQESTNLEITKNPSKTGPISPTNDKTTSPTNANNSETTQTEPRIYTTEEKREMLKSLGFTQTLEEALTNPSPETIAKFIEIGATAKELLTSGFHQVVQKSAKLSLEMDIYLTELGSPATYTEMTRSPFSEEGYKFLTEKLKLTDQEIFVDYGLNRLVIYNNPQKFLDMLNLPEDTYTEFHKLFPGPQYDSIWVETITSLVYKEAKNKKLITEYWSPDEDLLYTFLKEFETSDEAIANYDPAVLYRMTGIKPRSFSPSANFEKLQIFLDTKRDDITMQIPSNFLSNTIKDFVTGKLKPPKSQFIPWSDRSANFKKLQISLGILPDNIAMQIPDNFSSNIVKDLVAGNLKPPKRQFNPRFSPSENFKKLQIFLDTKRDDIAMQIPSNFSSSVIRELFIKNRTPEQKLIAIKKRQLESQYKINTRKFRFQKTKSDIQNAITSLFRKQQTKEYTNLDQAISPYNKDKNLRTPVVFRGDSASNFGISFLKALLTGFLSSIGIASLPDDILMGSEDTSKYFINNEEQTPTPTQSLSEESTAELSSVELLEKEWEEKYDRSIKYLPLPGENNNSTNPLYVESALFIQNILDSCQRFIEPSFNRSSLIGMKMKDCFCAHMANKCGVENSLEDRMGEEIRNIYNNNTRLDQKTFDRLINMVTFDKVEAIDPCVNSDQKLCDVNNKEVYAYCPWETAYETQPTVGDVIIKQDGTESKCVDIYRYGVGSASEVQIVCTTIVADPADRVLVTTPEIIDQKDIKAVWRPSTNKNGDACWNQ